MKLAYILPHLECYGGVRRALELANRLKERGHDVYFYTPSGTDCLWFPNKVPVRKLDKAGDEEFDCVIFSLEEQYEEPKKFKTKSVVYYILHYGVLYKNAEICRASYREPYYLIANSSWTAEKICEEIGRRPPVVYGGINFDLFHPVTTSKKFDVLSYGDTKREWKGRNDVEKIAMLRKDWKIAFMSDINPSQKDIARIYNSARVFFSASWFEGWNWMGLEAMACGVPLVITDDGGSRDYAKNEYNCLVVPPRDSESAIIAIEKLLSDKKLRKRLVKNGIETAKKFTWDSAITNFEKHLQLSLI